MATNMIKMYNVNQRSSRIIRWIESMILLYDYLLFGCFISAARHTCSICAWIYYSGSSRSAGKNIIIQIHSITTQYTWKQIGYNYKRIHWLQNQNQFGVLRWLTKQKYVLVCNIWCRFRIVNVTNKAEKQIKGHLQS